MHTCRTESGLGPVDESDFMAFKRLSRTIVYGALKTGDLKIYIPDPAVMGWISVTLSVKWWNIFSRQTVQESILSFILLALCQWGSHPDSRTYKLRSTLWTLPLCGRSSLMVDTFCPTR